MADVNSPEVWKELAAASTKIREEAARMHPHAEQVRVVIGPKTGRMELAWLDLGGDEKPDAALRSTISSLPRIEHVAEIIRDESRDGVSVTPIPDRRANREGENAFVFLDVTVRDFPA